MIVTEFSKLFDSSKDAVVAVSGNEIVYFNPTAKTHLGQLINNRPAVLFPNETDSDLEFNGVLYHVTVREAFEHKIYTLSPAVSASHSDELLYQVSGKLKDHLASLKLTCNMLMPIIEDSADEKTAELFRIIVKNSTVLHRLAGNLGYFQNFDSTSFAPSEFDAALCIRDIADSVPVFVGSKCPEIIFNCDENSLIIQADKEKLEFLVFQLISNSIKNTSSDGKITITLKKDADKMTIIVADNGRGIHPDQLENIWEPGNAVLSPANGAGIGLPIVQLIAKRHGGNALLTSSASGTVVTVSIPLIQEDTGRLNSLSAKYDSGLSDLMLQLSDVIPAENFCSRFMD